VCWNILVLRLTQSKSSFHCATSLEYVLVSLSFSLFFFLRNVKLGFHISESQVMKCMCPCIRDEDIRDCVCPDCVEMECELTALRASFVPCKKQCADCLSWKKAMVSVDTWLDQFSCEEEAMDGYERDGSSESFYMRPYSCCLDHADVIQPCDKCTLNLRLPKGTCEAFSATQMKRDVTWLKRQDTIEGKNHDKLVKRLRTFKGPFSELVDSVFKRTKPLLQHLWRCRFFRRQFHLDCDFLDPLTEAVILADFASQMVHESIFKILKVVHFLIFFLIFFH
jgi:hypothetical protein